MMVLFSCLCRYSDNSNATHLFGCCANKRAEISLSRNKMEHEVLQSFNVVVWVQMDLARQMMRELESTGGVGSTIVYARTRKETEEIALCIQEVVCMSVFSCVCVILLPSRVYSVSLDEYWWICHTRA